MFGKGKTKRNNPPKLFQRALFWLLAPHRIGVPLSWVSADQFTPVCVCLWFVCGCGLCFVLFSQHRRRLVGCFTLLALLLFWKLFVKSSTPTVFFLRTHPNYLCSGNSYPTFNYIGYHLHPTQKIPFLRYWIANRITLQIGDRRGDWNVLHRNNCIYFTWCLHN